MCGAKNIKAIAIRGTKRCEWSDVSGWTDLAKDLSQRSFGPATAKYRELGTAANLLLFNRLNVLPTRNFQHGSCANVESLAPEYLQATHQRTRASCACCRDSAKRPVAKRSGLVARNDYSDSL